ncbi:hypothetical protein IMSAG249_00410 [Lachnospiraceae bacterium]|nr:hypothetical protein IMSAG249_00410 [Lachnospiraceae bacterium]
MHKSSFMIMKWFSEKYMKSEKLYKILDIGSQDINGSYKPIFENGNWEYLGSDVVSGKNVDIVLEEAYHWKNIKSKTFDCVVCGQMLEHDEFFWLTMLEIKRIMKHGGLCCIIAPSSGPEHRYPVDCYRYYPDGLRAAARYAGLEVLEAFAQWNESIYPDMNSEWRDCILVCRRNNDNFWGDLKFSIRHWMLNVSSRSVCDNDYGNKYIQETTWTSPLPELSTAIYFNTGGGYNDEQMERHKVKTYQHFNRRYQVPDGCQVVRYDPIEGHRCIVRNLIVLVSTERLNNEEFKINGEKTSTGVYLFMDTTKPRIFIPLMKSAEWINIEADISFLG